MSVTGSLQWVVRIARVESQAAVSRLQQMKKHATVTTAVFANKVLQYLKKTANREYSEEARQTATKNRKQGSTKGEGAAGAATVEQNT